MTIAIAGVSFLGYAAVKFVGDRYGTLIAGIGGGLVSSTAVTVDAARKAAAKPERRRTELASALMAAAVMFLRVLVIVALFGPSHLVRLAGPLIAAGAVMLAASSVMLGPAWSHKRPDGDDGPAFANPFDLFSVLRFAALLAAILIVSRWLTAIFGGSGMIALAAATGLADVDAITLSIMRFDEPSLPAVSAEVAVLAAVTANSVAKTVIAFSLGGRGFGLGYAGWTAAALAAGGAVAFAAQILA